MHWIRKQGDEVMVMGHTHVVLEGRDNAALVFGSPGLLTVRGT